MQHLGRVSNYLVLQLVSAGFYCMEPKHLDATVVIAGKDGEGFVLLMQDGAPGAAGTNRPVLPDELSFLKLPVYPVYVTPETSPRVGQPMLVAVLDAHILAQLPQEEPGRFGITMTKLRTAA